MHQLEIAESIISTAETISKLSTKAFRSKKLFRSDKYDRRPGKRKKRNFYMAQILITSAMDAVNIAIIASQPIPKYPNNVANGSTVV